MFAQDNFLDRSAVGGQLNGEADDDRDTRIVQPNLVRADDVGVALAKNSGGSTADSISRAFGRALVLGMPGFLTFLSAVGTFLAALTAFASIGVIVLRENPNIYWTMMIMLGWVVGVAMQIVAGAIARVRP